MNLYIMRHGRTIWNERKITQGRIHNRLSAIGIKTSEECAKALKEVNFDYIFCSPLLRAVQTANIINRYQNKKVIKDERITDIDQGYFTGKYFNQLSEKELKIKESKDKAYGMESFAELYVRVKNFYNFLKQNYLNKTILIITHSCVASFLELMIKYENYDENVFNITTLFENSEFKNFIVN